MVYQLTLYRLFKNERVHTVSMRLYSNLFNKNALKAKTTAAFA